MQKMWTLNRKVAVNDSSSKNYIPVTCRDARDARDAALTRSTFSACLLYLLSLVTYQMPSSSRWGW